MLESKRRHAVLEVRSLRCTSSCGHSSSHCVGHMQHVSLELPLFIPSGAFFPLINSGPLETRGTSITQTRPHSCVERRRNVGTLQDLRCSRCTVAPSRRHDARKASPSDHQPHQPVRRGKIADRIRARCVFWCLALLEAPPTSTRCVLVEGASSRARHQNSHLAR